MQYMGSKKQVAKQVAAFLESVRAGRPLSDRFCGTLSITAAMSGERYASDVDPALVTLLTAVQRGWDPPSSVTEEDYARASADRDPTSPLTAFIGFGCSFGGKWFGGYARRNSNHWGREECDGRTSYKWAYNALDVRRWVERAPEGAMRCALSREDADAIGLQPPEKARHYFAQSARKALLETMRRCAGVPIRCADYREERREGLLVYADPEYQGTTGFKHAFDHAAFWRWAREESARNLVIVSEHVAPPDFSCVLEIGATGKLRGSGTRTVRAERLFIHEGRLEEVNRLRGVSRKGEG